MTSDTAVRKDPSEHEAAIDRLAGGVAHDFNDLLGIIIGNLDRIAEAELPDDERAGMVQAAMGAALRGVGLTRQLLAYARRQPLDPQILQLDHVLRDMTGLLQQVLGETIRAEMQLPPDLWPARLDLGQLQKAVLSLVVNARDAMPAGGRMVIAAQNTVLDAAAAAEIGAVPGRCVMIVVSDDGMGMPQEVAAHACDPCFTTRPAGAGLGLSTVQGFVRQSQGGLSIESELGRGTIVRLYFPAAEAETARPAANPGGLPIAREGEVVLVVEDDAALRKLTTGLLVSLGYRVLEAANGLSALVELDTAPRIDLMLTDILLPDGMSGLVLVREAATRRPGLRSLYMSGYGPSAFEELDPGASDALLMKPFRKADLARRVRQLLDDD